MRSDDDRSYKFYRASVWRAFCQPHEVVAKSGPLFTAKQSIVRRGDRRHRSRKCLLPVAEIAGDESSVSTTRRKRIEDLIWGVEGKSEHSDLVKLAARLIIEEALEGEVQGPRATFATVVRIRFGASGVRWLPL